MIKYFIMMALKNCGKTQQDLAEMVGTSQPNIARILKRDALTPLLYICKLLNIDVILRTPNGVDISLKYAINQVNSLTPDDGRKTKGKLNLPCYRKEEEK